MNFESPKLSESGSTVSALCDGVKRDFPLIPEGTPQSEWDQWPRESRLFAESGLTPAPAPEPPPPTYREKRAAKYIEELSDGHPTPLESTGDMLDALIKEVRALRTAAGGTADPDFAAKVAKIDSIKALYPKPS